MVQAPPKPKTIFYCDAARWSRHTAMLFIATDTLESCCHLHDDEVCGQS